MYQVTAYATDYPDGRGMIMATPKTLEQAEKWKQYLTQVYPNYNFVIGPFNTYHPMNVSKFRKGR
jgi:hypothetical protein